MNSKDSSERPLGSLQTVLVDSQSQDTTSLAKKIVHVSKWSPGGGKDLKEEYKESEGVRKSAEERGAGVGGQGDGGGGGIENSLEENDLVTGGGGGGGEGEGGGEGGGGGGGEVNEVQPLDTKDLKRDDNANYLDPSSNALLPEQEPYQQQENESDLASDRAQVYHYQPRELLPVSQEEKSEQMIRDDLRQELSDREQEQNTKEDDNKHLQGKENIQEPHEYRQKISLEHRIQPEDIHMSSKDGQEDTQTLDNAEQKEQAKNSLRQSTEAENADTLTKLRKTEAGPYRLECPLQQSTTSKENTNSCEDEGETEGRETDRERLVSWDEALNDYDKTISTPRLACYPQDEEETKVMLYSNNNDYSDTKIQLDEKDLSENLLGNHGDEDLELGIKSLSTSTLNTKDGRSSDGQPRASCSFPHAGILLAIASSFCFSLGSALVKVLHQMDPMEMVVFRFFLMWILNLPLLVHSRQHPFPEGQRLRLVVRGVAGASAVMCHFYAFRHMPIADAGTITFTSPIVVLLFSWVLLKEPCDVFNVILVMMTLSGIVCIAKPAFIFTNLEVPQKSEQEIWGLVACLGGVVGQACVYIILRLLREAHYVVVLNMFCIVAVIMTSCVTLVSSGPISLPNLRQVGFILVLGFSSFTEQVLLTKAMQVEHASTVSIARMSSVLFGFLLQILLFGHYPDAFSIGGAIMVSSCVVLLGVKTWWKTRKEAEKMEKE